MGFDWEDTLGGQSYDDAVYDAAMQMEQMRMIDEDEEDENIHSKDDFMSFEITRVPCPKCGSRLVARKGKNGLFVGCSGFPGCKYTENATLERFYEIIQDLEKKDEDLPFK